MSAVDYGSVVYKNGTRYKADYLYPDIDELGVLFYKTCLRDISTDEVIKYFGFDGKVSIHFNLNNSTYWVKKICDGVWTARVYHNSDIYNIVFGYGIDNYRGCWDAIKVKYLGKKNSKKVDRCLKRIGF